MIYLSSSTRYLVYQIVDGERIPFGDYEIGEWDLSLCTGYPEPYPDPSVRPGYMHSFAITENYIILPTTSYFLDYCQFFGKLKEFSFRNFIGGFGKTCSRQWLRIVPFFINMDILLVQGHVYSVNSDHLANCERSALGAWADVRAWDGP